MKNEDNIIIGGELFPRGNNFSSFSPGFACSQLKFHLGGAFYRRDSQLVRGLTLL